jgi:hypothetical protein
MEGIGEEYGREGDKCMKGISDWNKQSEEFRYESIPR